MPFVPATTAADFRAFYAEAAEATATQLDPIVRSAGRWVAKLAPRPDKADPTSPDYDPGVEADYEQARFDAELQLTRYLFKGSHVSSESRSLDILSGSTSHVNDPKVIAEIVSNVVGEYYSPAGAVAYISPTPW